MAAGKIKITMSGIETEVDRGSAPGAVAPVVIDNASTNLQEKAKRLKHILSQLGSTVVAYSGGVDSSLLAYYARSVLGDKARVVIAISPSLPAGELEAARLQAKTFDWDLLEIHTDEVENIDYQRNDGARCYFCKSTLFEELRSLTTSLKINSIVYGANQDDLDDNRPGHIAAHEYNVLSPLQDAALSKEEIRELAKLAGLPSWDRPQAACLASRIPTFEKVTVEKLSKVEKAEEYLHSLGFRQVRVRHHGDLARIELEQEDLCKLLSDGDQQVHIAGRLKALGYRHVTVDIEGYRSGSTA